MFGITDISTYVIGTIAVILLPGPNSMYCLTIAGQYGTKTAYRSIGGILLGDSILMLASGLGAGTLLKVYPAFFHGIQLLGGLYLAYLGFNLWRAAVKKWYFRQPKYVSQAPQLSAPSVFKRALGLSLLNPKAILFCLSFFVQFVEPTYPHPALSFVILATILQIISFTYLSVLAFSGNRLAQTFRQHTRMSAIAMGLVGVMFVGFAVKMWVA